MTNELALWPLGREGMLVPFTVEEEAAGEGVSADSVFAVPGALRGLSSLGGLTRIEALEQPDQKEGSRQTLFILTLLPGWDCPLPEW